MAADLVNCPECHRQLRVPEELVGQQVKCPTCGHVFIANPEVSAPPPLRTESDAPCTTQRRKTTTSLPVPLPVRR